jgi:hypothetical protein
MEVGSVEENVLRCVRYNEVALLNGRIDHSQNSLNVEKYSVTKKWSGEHIRFTIHLTAKKKLITLQQPAVRIQAYFTHY